MARENFPGALSAVLRHEGGYVNHPRDPGGATNKGVTQRVYDAFRRRKGLPLRSVRNIEGGEAAEIYRTGYWNPIRGDDLPAGLDYCLFDFAVNSGVSRAARMLQLELGVAPDGSIGPATLAAVRARPVKLLIAGICARRLVFLKSLSTFDAFGKGWTRRVADVLDHAAEMAS